MGVRELDAADQFFAELFGDDIDKVRLAVMHDMKLPAASLQPYVIGDE